MKTLGVISVLLLTLVLASPSVGDAQVLQPGALVAWMDHLESLGIPFESRIVPDVGHSTGGIFSQIGDEIITFSERCFQRARLDQL